MHAVLAGRKGASAGFVLELPPRDGVAPARGVDPAWLPTRRARIWDLSSNLHCSIVGTCLTTGELRRLLVKILGSEAETASDHVIHSSAVNFARRGDAHGKMLNKLLDRRHEGHIKRFAKAESVTALRTLWLAALEVGDIPGAYWATMTHPAVDGDLAREAFCEVHMLSHLVGMSNRADIARLKKLESELNTAGDKLARQQTQIARYSGENQTLQDRLRAAEGEVAVLRSAASAGTGREAENARDAKFKLTDQAAHIAALEAKLAAAETRAIAAEAKYDKAQSALAASRKEIELLESYADASSATAPESDMAIDGVKLLYIGGRPKLLATLRGFVERLGGELLAHDGGTEDALTLLPGLVRRADVVMFPVDCVGHQAMYLAKKHCRALDKTYVPLRNASLACFAANLRRWSVDRVAMAAARPHPSVSALTAGPLDAGNRAPVLRHSSAGD